MSDQPDTNPNLWKHIEGGKHYGRGGGQRIGKSEEIIRAQAARIAELEELVDRLREQNHDAAAVRDDSERLIRSELDGYRNARRRVLETLLPQWREATGMVLPSQNEQDIWMVQQATITEHEASIRKYATHNQPCIQWKYKCDCGLDELLATLGRDLN